MSDALFSVDALDNTDVFLDKLVAYVRANQPITTPQIAKMVTGAVAYHWEPDDDDDLDMASALGLAVVAPKQLTPEQELQLLGAFVLLLANALQRIANRDEP